eukprot:scaffold33103_cov22-Tisochrysis_lutea.AAC.1
MTRRSPHCYHGLPVREQLFITRTGILDTRHVSRVWKRIISTCRLQDLPQCLGFNPRHLAQVYRNVADVKRRKDRSTQRTAGLLPS